MKSSILPFYLPGKADWYIKRAVGVYARRGTEIRRKGNRERERRPVVANQEIHGCLGVVELFAHFRRSRRKGVEIAMQEGKTGNWEEKRMEHISTHPI